MKYKALKVVAGLSLLAMVPTVAMAHTNLSIGLGLGGGGYYEPAVQPVYAPPPPVVYEAPAPVVYGPSYYGPSVVYEQGYYGRPYGYGYHHWDGYRRY